MTWAAAFGLLWTLAFYADFGVVTSHIPLTIEPRHARVRPRDNVTVMCRAGPGVELSDCQFTWWDVDDVKEGPYFDFGEGKDSDFSYLTNTSEMDWRLAGYRYAGEGLHRGQCGIQLYGVLLRYRMMGCRVRTRGGSWNYATMTICSEEKEPFVLDFAPMQPVVLVGQSPTFLCRTSNQLASCKFRFPGIDVISFSNVTPRAGGRRNHTRNGTAPTLNQNKPKWSRYGKTLEEGQCGVRLQNITETHDGWFYFDAETPSGGYDRRVFYLTVARPPAEVTMQVSKHNLQENEFYSVTCRVTQSRPAANISWYLGNRLLRHDNLDDSTPENNAESPWRWSHGLHSVSQTMTRTADRADNGKILSCVVGHVALTNTMVAIIPISVSRGTGGGSAIPPFTGGAKPPPPVRVFCPALALSNDVTLQCKLIGRAVDCSRPMEVGTEVRMYPRCSSSQQVVPRDASYRVITCLASGNWDRPALRCSPPTPSAVTPSAVTPSAVTPGRVTPSAVAGCGSSARAAGGRVMVNGGSVALGEFPWHVGIYKLYNGAYEHVCAGTIIAPNIALTAATCVTTDARHSYPANESLFQVAAGKLKRAWGAHEEHAQTRGVASLSMHESYLGSSTFYTHNVAILKLSTAFEITSLVNVVCLDWEPSVFAQDRYLTGKVGHVAGWAFTEEDSPGPELKSVQLPCLEYGTCFRELAPYLSRLLTIDQFCAGSTNEFEGYTACECDYGAGLVVYNEDKRAYYLQGVASVAYKPVTNRETCYPTHLVSFSKIASFAEWVQSKMRVH